MIVHLPDIFLLVSTTIAAERLEKLFSINARLPKSEIRDRLKQWREVRD